MILAFGLSISLIGTAFATSTSWDYGNDYSHGKYVPLRGTFSDRVGWESGYDDIMTTEVNFSLDSTNVSAILAYNRGEGEHPNTKGVNCYLTLDVTSVRDNTLDPFSAYIIYTNLPDPKRDIENDDFFGDRNEESEVVALGTVEATDYYMRTCWDDFRNSDKDTGEFRAQFAMSKKGFSDYNNIIQSNVVQGIIRYGGYAGDYRALSLQTPQSNFNDDLSPATITFNRKLTASELDAFCMTHGIEIKQVQARGIDQDGSRVTFDSLATKGLTGTEQLLQAVSEKDNIDYRGFVSAYVYIPIQNLGQIEEDILELANQEGRYTRNCEESQGIRFPHSLVARGIISFLTSSCNLSPRLKVFPTVDAS